MAINYSNFDFIALSNNKIPPPEADDFAVCGVPNFTQNTMSPKTLGQWLAKVFVMYARLHEGSIGSFYGEGGAPARIIALCRRRFPDYFYRTARRVACAVIGRSDPDLYLAFRPSKKAEHLRFNKGWFKLACKNLQLDPAKIKRGSEFSKMLEEAVIEMGAEKVTKSQFMTHYSIRVGKKTAKKEWESMLKASVIHEVKHVKPHPKEIQQIITGYRHGIMGMSTSWADESGMDTKTTGLKEVMDFNKSNLINLYIICRYIAPGRDSSFLQILESITASVLLIFRDKQWESMIVDTVSVIADVKVLAQLALSQLKNRIGLRKMSADPHKYFSILEYPKYLATLDGTDDEKWDQAQAFIRSQKALAKTAPTLHERLMYFFGWEYNQYVFDPKKAFLFRTRKEYQYFCCEEDKLEEVHTGIMDVLSKLSESDFLVEIRKVGLVCSMSIVGQKLLGLLGGFPSILGVFNILKGCLDATSLISCFDSLLEKFVEQVVPCFTNWNLDSLKPNNLKKRLQCIAQIDQINESGFPLQPMSGVLTAWGGLEHSKDLYSTRLDFIVFLDEALAYLVKSDTNAPNLFSMNAITLRARTNLIALIKSSNRSMPLCVGFRGISNSGKSEYLIKRAPRVLMDILHLTPRYEDDDGDKVMYAPTPEFIVQQNFQENITSSTEIIMFDDFLQVVTPAGQNPTVKIFWDIQSIGSVQIEKAAITQKSGCFYNNKLTLLSSNLDKYGTKGHVECEEAFMRRIQFDVIVTGDHQNPTFEVQALEFGKTSRKVTVIHRGSREERLKQLDKLLADYAQRYMEYNAETLERTKKLAAMCPTCKMLVPLCTCQTICLTINPVASASSGCFMGSLMQDMEDSSTKIMYIVMCVFMEEYLFSSLLEYVSPLSLVFLRIALDYFSVQHITLPTLVMYFGLSILLYGHIFLSIPFHILYNLLVLTELWSDLRHQVLTRLIFKFNTVQNWFRFDLNHDNLGPAITITKELQKVCIDQAYDAFVEGYLKKQLGKIAPVAGFLGVLLGLYAGHSIMKSTLASFDSFTAIGEPASDEDKSANDQWDKMVKSGYGGVQHGKAQSWKQNLYSAVGIPSNGTKPRTIANNIFKIRVPHGDEMMKGWGYYCEGRVFFPAHILLGAKLNEAVIEFTAPDNSVVQLTWSSSTVFPGKRDIAWIEWSGPKRRSTTMHVDVLHARYTFGVGADLTRASFLHMTRDSPHGVPDGDILIDYPNKFGLSGTPVFIIHNGSTDIQPVFCGVISRMVNVGEHTGKTIFSPLDLCSFSQASNLEEEITVQTVQEVFTMDKFPLNPESSPKSILGHLEQEEFDNLGQYCGNVDKLPFTPNTAYRKTHLYEKAKIFCPDVEKFGIPVLHPRIRNNEWISPILAGVRQMANCGQVINEAPFISASDLVFNQIYKHLAPFLHLVEPLSARQVIRGTTHTNPLNLKAGCGFPLFHQRKVDIVKGTLEDPVFIKPFADRLTTKLHQIDMGIPALNISVANIKDEIISEAKIWEGLERMYFAGNSDFLALCKRYFAGYLDLFTAHRDVLFGQIGMNAIGKELSQKIKGTMKRLNISRHEKAWLDSDFSKYDKTLIALKYGVRVLNKLVNKTPYFQNNPIEMKRAKMLLASLQQWVVIIGNDVFLMNTKLPSGVFATAWLNCICECILEVLQFYYCLYCDKYKQKPKYHDFVKMLENEEDFFEKIGLMNFGDDNHKGVHKSVRHIYNHDRIMDFADYVSMKITPAKKDELTIEYKTIEETTFLKRTPIYNDRLEEYVGRLDFTSIGRMLCFTDSDEPSWEASVLDQAMREMSYYPKEEFDRFCTIFGLVADYEATQDKAMEHVWKKDDPIQEMFNEGSSSFTSEIQGKIKVGVIYVKAAYSTHKVNGQYPQGCTVPLSISSSPLEFKQFNYPIGEFIMLIPDRTIQLDRFSLIGKDHAFEQAGARTEHYKRIHINSDTMNYYMHVVKGPSIPWDVGIILEGKPRDVTPIPKIIVPIPLPPPPRVDKALPPTALTNLTITKSVIGQNQPSIHPKSLPPVFARMSETRDLSKSSVEQWDSVVHTRISRIEKTSSQNKYEELVKSVAMLSAVVQMIDYPTPEEWDFIHAFRLTKKRKREEKDQ